MKKSKINANYVIAGLIGFVLLVVLGTFLAVAWRGSAVPAAKPAPAPVDLKQLHQDWLDAVAKQTSTLDASSDSQKVRGVVDALLALRVTASDRDAHLNLVMALLSMERDETGAWPRVQSAIVAIESR